VDQFDPYMAILTRERAANPSGFVGGGDAVHPGPIGHTVMAWAILKGLGAPALVSRAEIDAAAQKVVAARNCRIDNVKTANGILSFDRLDSALPMPIDPKAQAALTLAPILQDLDQYELQVRGLAGGSYEITIDGELAAKVSGEDLAKGWNMAQAAGPIAQQAQQVLKMVFQKNNTFFHRWRDVQLFTFPDWAQNQATEDQRAAELKRLDQQIAEAEAQIERDRKPKSHHFELKPATP